MTEEILKFFQVQRSIFGVCPHSGEIFRLSDCKLFLKTKPTKDWMDVLKRKELRLDKLDESIEEARKHLKELAHRRGRRRAQTAVRKVDPVFTPRNLNPDDAKVVFHPIDYLARIIHEHGGILPKPVDMRVCDRWRQKRIRHSVVLPRDIELPSRPHKIWLRCNRAMKFMNKAG